MRKRRELAPPKFPLVSNLISPRGPVEKFERQEGSPSKAAMRFENPNVLRAKEAKTMPSTRATKNQATPARRNPCRSTIFGNAKILRGERATRNEGEIR